MCRNLRYVKYLVDCRWHKKHYRHETPSEASITCFDESVRFFISMMR